MNKSERYLFNIFSGTCDTKKRFCIDATPDRNLHPTRMMNNADYPGQIMIESIFINNEDQLVRGEVDAWYYSLKRSEELEKEFMTKHGLKTFEDYERYCNENDDRPIDIHSVNMFVMAKGKPVRITGRYVNCEKEKLFIVTFSGPGY